MRARDLSIAAIVLCIVPSTVYGQTPFVTVCAPSESVDPRLHHVLCAELSATLRNIDNVRIVREDNHLNSGGEYSPRVLLSDTKELMEAAHSNLEAGDAQAALAQSSDAVDSLLGLDPWLSTRETLVTGLLLQLRATLAARGRIDAQEATLRALTLSPALRRSWQTQVREEPLREVFRKAQSKYWNIPRTARLEVQCIEDHAEIYIDGILVGVTPARIEGVVPGEHIIRIRKRGYVPVSTQVRFAGGQLSTVDADLEEASNLPAWEQIRVGLGDEIGQTHAGPSLRDLGTLLFAERIIAMRIQPDPEGVRIDTYLYDLRSAQLLTQAGRTLPSTRPVARQGAISAVLGTLLNQAIPTIAQASGDDHFYEEWWFWTGIGTAVTAAVALAVVFTADAPPKPTGEGAIEIRP